MKSKAIVLALLACVFGAQAEVVSSQQAAVAAGAWARLGKGVALGAQLGEQVVSTREIVVTNGCSFHVVRLESGTVFLSGDTDFEPVIAFSANPDVTLEKGTPLYDLLYGDMRARVGDRNRRRAAAVAAGKTAVGVASLFTRENGLWADLLGSEKNGSSAAVSSEKPQTSLAQDEIYVEQMLKTQWSQDYAGSKKCYNYYTPNGWPCGCGATAMAQIMRYHAFPTDPIDTETDFEIAVGTTPQTVKMEGGKSGVFDWDKMPNVPAKVTLTDEMCEAIGKLTYNAGVALHMRYGKSGSDATPDAEWPAFKTFGYQSGQVFWDGTSYSTGQGGLHVAATRHNVVLTSLDAGCPVLFSIYGYEKVNGQIVRDSEHWAGHAVVGDGYGFKKINGVSTEYVHINLGWAGTDDAWYNIPEIDCSQSGATSGGSAVDFLYLGGAAYGISPTAMKEIVSGRLADEDGIGLTNDVVVTAYNPETGDVLATVNPGPHGVFVFQFDPGVSCLIEAETTAGRKLVATMDEPITVGTTVADEETGFVAKASDVGSLWLGDIVMKAPTVAVVDGTTGEEVSQTRTLDQALALAAEVSNPTLKILFETTLRTSVAVDYACTIVATNDDPYAARIVCADGAALTVADGGDVALTNIVFGRSSATPVCTLGSGVVRLGGTVDFNVTEGVTAVSLAEAGDIKIVAPLTRGFALACEGAMGLGDAFGAVEWDGVDVETAAASARLIANADYESGEVRGSVRADGGALTLVWAEMPVPVEESVGYFLNADGTTNTSARLDFLFGKYTAAAASLAAGTRIVVRKSGALKSNYTLAHDVRIVGEKDVFGDWPTVTAAKDAGFVVSGGTFDMANILFVSHEGKPLVDVQGATGALSNCRFTDILGTTGVSGALAVRAQGAVTVRDCVFSDCRAWMKQVNCCGGAVSVCDAGSRLAVYDTEISGCTANAFGGGIFAEKGTALEIGGRLVVRGNTQKASGEAGNIYFDRTNVTLHVAEKLTGGTGAVGLRIYQGNKAGHVFATMSGELGALDVLTTAQSFSNDAEAGLEAEDVDEKGEQFAWRTRIVDRTVDKSVAVAATRRAGESILRYYGTVADAFAALNGAGGTLSLLKNCDFVDDVTLTNDVTITSQDGTPVLTRANAASLTVAADVTLTLENVVIEGLEELADVKTAFFCVDGGTLDLRSGACVRNLHGDGSRASGAVAVYNGGTFILNAGAAITACGNDWRSDADATGYGAVTIDAGTAELRGGTINKCWAYAYGGGLFAGNGSTVRVSGEPTVLANTNALEKACNLTVADKSSLELSGALTGRVGVKRAFSAPTDVFGTVTADLAYATLTNSAANFSNDETGAYGMAVTNAAKTATRLVWSTAIAEDGSVELEEDGETVTYWCVGDIPPKTPKATPLPIAFSSLVTAVEPDEYVISVTAAVAKCWYSLYETNSLTGGFKTEGVAPVDRKQAMEDGTIQFTRPRTGESRFWKVIAEPEQ